MATIFLKRNTFYQSACANKIDRFNDEAFNVT